MWAFNNNCRVKLNLLFKNAINIRVNFGLTCDPLSEDLDESDVIVGSGSVSLKQTETHYDDKTPGSQTSFCMSLYL